MNNLYSVAIDGPGGAGKSTIARAAAAKFGFIYVDTGAIYRCVGLAALRSGIASGDDAAVAELLGRLRIEIRFVNGEQRMLLDGEDVSAAIRAPAVSLAASDFSALPRVRAFLLDMQRAFARRASVIMDGRDIGTVVLPDADLKIFLTASPEARARRRYLELRAKGSDAAYEDVYAELVRRDEQDSTRAAAPLRAAPDAVLLDTSDKTLEESIGLVTALMEARLCR